MMRYGHDAIRNLELGDRGFDAYSNSTYEIGIDENDLYTIYDSSSHDPSSIVASSLSAQEVVSFFESLAMPNFSLDERWDLLVEFEVATDAELNLVCDINGYNEDTFDAVVFARTGFHYFKDFYWEVIANV